MNLNIWENVERKDEISIIIILLKQKQIFLIGECINNSFDI